MSIVKTDEKVLDLFERFFKSFCYVLRMIRSLSYARSRISVLVVCGTGLKINMDARFFIKWISIGAGDRHVAEIRESALKERPERSPIRVSRVLNETFRSGGNQSMTVNGKKCPITTQTFLRRARTCRQRPTPDERNVETSLLTRDPFAIVKQRSATNVERATHAVAKFKKPDGAAGRR